MTNKRFTVRSAAYLILIKKDKILLLRRFNTGWEDGKYSLIAGHLDGNETVTQTMIREAREESGVIIKQKDLRVVHVMHRKSNEEFIDFFLIANHWENEPQNKEYNKCDDMRWFQLSELPKNLLPHVKKAIENYLNKISFSEFGWEL